MKVNFNNREANSAKGNNSSMHPISEYHIDQTDINRTKT